MFLLTDFVDTVSRKNFGEKGVFVNRSYQSFFICNACQYCMKISKGFLDTLSYSKSK